MAELVAAIEAEAAAKREETGIQPPGPETVRSQNPHARPMRTKKSRAPLFHAASRVAREELYQAYAWFVGAFREAAEKLRQKLEKKRSDLALREQEVSGRKREKWIAIGTAVLSNIGLFTGRKRSVSGVGSVLSKDRMEGTAEARLDALKAEVGALERQLAETTDVDPGRLVEETLAPVLELPG